MTNLEPSLRQRLDGYLAKGRSINLSPRTLRSVRYDALRFLGWLETNHQVGEVGALKRTHLDDWMRHLSARLTTKGQPLKAGSVNKQIANIRGFLVWLSDEGLVAPLLARGLDYVKEPHLLPGSVLTDAQVRKLIAAVETDTPVGHRDRVIVELLYTSGIRAAELLGLRVDDLDLGSGTALIRGKGNKERVVPVGRTAVSLLEGYLSAVRPLLLSDHGERTLFLDERGKALPYHSLLRRVRGYADAAELKIRVTPHTFRRSCTTELLRAGANMYHVKEMLGHESLDTLRHYARLTIMDLRKTHRRCHPRERGVQE